MLLAYIFQGLSFHIGKPVSLPGEGYPTVYSLEGFIVLCVQLRFVGLSFLGPFSMAIVALLISLNLVSMDVG